jgi:hypothetical protein
MPVRTLGRVDFPLPDFPVTAIISPLSTEREISCKAQNVPWAVSKDFVTSLTSMIGSTPPPDL